MYIHLYVSVCVHMICCDAWIRSTNMSMHTYIHTYKIYHNTAKGMYVSVCIYVYIHVYIYTYIHANATAKFPSLSPLKQYYICVLTHQKHTAMVICVGSRHKYGQKIYYSRANCPMCLYVSMYTYIHTNIHTCERNSQVSISFSSQALLHMRADTPRTLTLTQIYSSNQKPLPHQKHMAIYVGGRHLIPTSAKYAQTQALLHMRADTPKAHCYGNSCG